jgi:hypothetical protein
MKQLDWEATEARARQMTEDEIMAALADIAKVIPNVRAIERAGWLPAEAKSEGYYCDEASVYRRELAHRAKGSTPLGQLIAAGNRMAEALGHTRERQHPAIDDWQEAVQRVDTVPVEPL